VDAECKSLISICFSKIAGAPIGSPKFLGSKEESMACALRRYGVTDSGIGKAGVFMPDAFLTREGGAFVWISVSRVVGQVLRWQCRQTGLKVLR
jgi:hypothetical protein